MIEIENKNNSTVDPSATSPAFTFRDNPRSSKDYQRKLQIPKKHLGKVIRIRENDGSSNHNNTSSSVILAKQMQSPFSGYKAKSLENNSKQQRLIKIIDPVNKRLMLQIRNPKIPINLDESSGGINLEQALDQFVQMPDFGFVENSLEFQNTKRGWQLIADIIRPKDYQTKFWKLVQRLQEVKNRYNDILQKKKEAGRKKRKRHQSSKNNNFSIDQAKQSDSKNAKSTRQKQRVVFEDQIASPTKNTLISQNSLKKSDSMTRNNGGCAVVNGDKSDSFVKIEEMGEESYDSSPSPKIREMKSTIKKLKSDNEKFQEDYQQIKKEGKIKNAIQHNSRRISLLKDNAAAQNEQHQQNQNYGNLNVLSNIKIERFNTQYSKASDNHSNRKSQPSRKHSTLKKASENLQQLQDLKLMLHQLHNDRPYRISLDLRDSQMEIDMLVKDMTHNLQKKTEQILNSNENTLKSKNTLFEKQSTGVKTKRSIRKATEPHEFPQQQQQQVIDDSLATDEDNDSQLRSFSRYHSLLRQSNQEQKPLLTDLAKYDSSKVSAPDQNHSSINNLRELSGIGEISSKTKFKQSFKESQSPLQSKFSKTGLDNMKNSTQRQKIFFSPEELSNHNKQSRKNAPKMAQTEQNFFKILIKRPKVDYDEQIRAFKARQDKAKQKQRIFSFEENLRSYNASSPFQENINHQYERNVARMNEHNQYKSITAQNSKQNINSNLISRVPSSMSHSQFTIPTMATVPKSTEAVQQIYYNKDSSSLILNQSDLSPQPYQNYSSSMTRPQTMSQRNRDKEVTLIKLYKGANNKIYSQLNITSNLTKSSNNWTSSGSGNVVSKAYTLNKMTLSQYLISRQQSRRISRMNTRDNEMYQTAEAVGSQNESKLNNSSLPDFRINNQQQL